MNSFDGMMTLCAALNTAAMVLVSQVNMAGKSVRAKMTVQMYGQAGKRVLLLYQRHDINRAQDGKMSEMATMCPIVRCVPGQAGEMNALINPGSEDWPIVENVIASLKKGTTRTEVPAHSRHTTRIALTSLCAPPSAKTCPFVPTCTHVCSHLPLIGALMCPHVPFCARMCPCA